MGYLVGETGRATEVPALAQRHLYTQQMRIELEFRPWLIGNQPVHNVDVFHRLREQGRGALFNYMHHGYNAGAMASFGAHGVPIHVSMAPQYFEAGSGYWGMRNRWHVRSVRMNGTRTFNAVGAFSLIADLLRAGEFVALAHDFPGSTWTTFLGRQVGARSGVAKLSLRTGAPVVVVTSSPHGLTAQVHAHEPIEPGDFETVDALQREIFRRHEPAVLAWPEALITPLTRWTPEPKAAALFGAHA